MTQTQLRSMFRKAYNGDRNFLTPNVSHYGESAEHVYELSSGQAIQRNGRMFGVTVLTKAGEKSALSTCFDNLQRAQEYADDLT